MDDLHQIDRHALTKDGIAVIVALQEALDQPQRHPDQTAPGSHGASQSSPISIPSNPCRAAHTWRAASHRAHWALALFCDSTSHESPYGGTPWLSHHRM